MSPTARMLRLISGLLFIGAAIMTYVAFDRGPITNLVSILFLVIGLTNIILIFVLARFFPQFSGDD